MGRGGLEVEVITGIMYSFFRPLGREGGNTGSARRGKGKVYIVADGGGYILTHSVPELTRL